MTDERTRRLQQQALFRNGDYEGMMLSLMARIQALETHTGYVAPEPEPEERPDPLAVALARAEVARLNIQEAQPEPVEAEPAEAAPEGPPAGFEDLARENEPWGETELKLLEELRVLRSRVVSGGALEPLAEGEGPRLNRLERLFRNKGRPAFEQAG